MIGYKGGKKFLTISLFLLPSLCGLLTFILIPILGSFFLSFNQWDLLSPMKWVGLKNYIHLFTDAAFYTALKNTVLFILGYLPVVIGIALLLALLLNKKITGQVFFRAVYFLPVVSSWVAVSLIWKWLFNAEYGLINYFLSLAGLSGPAWLNDPHWAMPAVIITSIWKDTGFVMVIFLAGLQEIPDYYYEAAEIDGANGWQKLKQITLPLLSDKTFFVLTISLINSFQVFDQIWIMTQGGPAGATAVLVEQIYKNAFKYYKMGYASALSWVLFAIILMVTLVQNRLKKDWSQT